MDENFIRERITQLRLKKNVSEYKMSYDLGHSKSYVQSISSGRAMPSMGEFLYMCEYFGITPAQFFSSDNNDPVTENSILDELRDLDDDDLQMILMIAKRLNKKEPDNKAQWKRSAPNIV